MWIQRLLYIEKPKKRGDRLEREGNKFQEKYMMDIWSILEKYLENIKIIDATKSKEEVFEETKNHIKNFLKRRGII